MLPFTSRTTQLAATWQQLLRHVRPLSATPFLLEIGIGQRSTASPAPSIQNSSPLPLAPSLPIFSASVGEMSGFELDYVFRSLACVTGSRSTPLHDVSAGLLGCLSSSSAALDEPSRAAGDADPAWRHVCDLIIMPDGCVAFGWMHNHALDLCWRHHALGYLADIFARSPGRLWKDTHHNIHTQLLQLVRMSWRHLPLMQWTSTVSEADVTQAITLVRGALVRPAGTCYELENEVCAAAAAGGCAVSLSTARTLIHLMAQREQPLPAGTAIALMRMVVCAHAAHAKAANDGLEAALVATAVRVCALSRDSGCHRLLTWAAALIRADAVDGPTTAEAAAEVLMLTLHEVLAAPGSSRDAQLRSCAEGYLQPLCDALFSAEALLLDSVSSFRSQAVLEVQRPGVAEAQSFASAADSADTAMFGRALGQAAPAPAELALEAARRAADTTAGPPLPWVPGVGTDVKGCWCALLTHTTLLATHTRGRSNPRRGATQKIGAAAAHHTLRVNLARRCLYNPDDATAATHYSLLTHLFSCAAAPLRHLVLVHLGSRAPPPSDVPADQGAAHRAAVGLLFLFPALPLRALCGGSVAEACAAFASAKAGQLPCHAGTDDSAVTLSIPKRDAERLAERLQGRESAVLCVVQMMGTTQAAFLLDELPMYLHTLLDSS